MNSSDGLLSGITSAQKRVLSALLEWYWVDRPSEIVEKYFQYAKALWESFSVPFMLKTLLSPWKKITDGYPTKGFNLEAIAQTFFLNMTSRGIGFVMRVFCIIAGIFIQVALLAAALAYAIAWLVFPVLLVAFIPLVIVFIFS